MAIDLSLFGICTIMLILLSIDEARQEKRAREERASKKLEKAA
jgi:hypothetical protein